MSAEFMEFIPAIDLVGVDAVRLHQGNYDQVTRYGDPLTLAARFAAEGARWIHVVDLDGARSGVIRPQVIRPIVEAASPALVQVSGGVRSVADAEALVSAGATRVVVGTSAWTLLDALVARDGVLRTRGWTDTALLVDAAIERCRAGGVSRVLCTAIERDGTLAGP